MENVIQELLQIELEANELVNAVVDEKRHLKERIAKMAESVKSEINQRTLETITKMYEAEHIESSQKISEINRKSQAWMSSLEKSYQQNRAKWEDDIVKKIIGQ
ncbi:MAG: hypothetical protein LBU32_07940 [Clostridiales bacterium]|jgi:hypothetical protein|nr:hypothetical protein [Clostridiales bacterium]